MSGFVGFTGEIENAQDVIVRMMSRIAHRGPDSTEVYKSDDVTMGFCKLSVIGLEDSKEPIYNEDKTIAAVLDGGIFNYQKLKDDLEQLGHTFASHAYTEAIVHLYEEYGVEMLDHIRGVFAFAIYDTQSKKLFCARDFFGVKPLYYSHINGNIMFASEIKSFLEYPLFKKEVNEEALENYMTFQYSVLTETFFQGVFKLPPGHYMLYEDNELTIKQYWQSRFDPEDMELPEAVNMLENTLQETIDLYKQTSEAEVGSLLSSGVDSSLLAASFKGDKTFTVGFDHDKYNETDYAKALTAQLGIENYSKIISADEYWDHLSVVQYHMDEPLADASAVALYFACKTASQYVKVVLSGEGPDEFFGGYNIYKEPLDIKPLTSLPRFIRKFFGALASAVPFRFKGKNLLIRASKDIEERYIGNAFVFTKKEREKLLRRPKGRYNPNEITAPIYKQCLDRSGQAQDDITKMQTLDIHLWMVGDILLKADKMSMANSVEIRAPFMDKEAFLAASKLPTALRCNKRQTKYAFRQLAHKKLPQEIANKKKLGFPVPIRIWLKEEKYYSRVKKYFTSPAAEKYFNVDLILKLLEKHKKGRCDNSRKIWVIFMFLVWHEQFFPEEL